MMASWEPVVESPEEADTVHPLVLTLQVPAKQSPELLQLEQPVVTMWAAQQFFVDTPLQLLLAHCNTAQQDTHQATPKHLNNAELEARQ